MHTVLFPSRPAVACQVVNLVRPDTFPVILRL